MVLVLGLGNPGTKYEHTRHNVGALALESCAAFFQLRLKKRCFRLYRRATVDDRALLVQSLTYMNKSGAVLRYFPALPLVVLCDQMDLPAGKIRLRRGGSSAGHRGLSSVMNRRAMGISSASTSASGVRRKERRSSTTCWEPSMTMRYGPASPVRDWPSPP